MVDQVTLQTVSILLAGMGMVIALVYYTLTIRNQNRTRQAQLMMNLYEAYRSPEFRESWGRMMDQEFTDFDDFWGKYGSEVDRESWNNWQSLAAYFHGIGVLLKEGLIEIRLLDQLLINLVLISWLKMEPIVYGFRDRTKSSLALFEGRGGSKRHPHYSGFEYLYNELRKREDASIF
jgi:hypothetical protein